MKNQLTALIVSFFRIEYLELCVKSLREIYPDINIIVGNNGGDPESKRAICQKYQADYYDLPFDCGICVGRNMLVDLIKTPYTLIGDDDFLYTKDAKLELMLDLIKNSNFDMVGGRAREGGKVRDYQGFIEDHGNYMIWRKLNDNGAKLQPADITFNFFIGKTEVLKQVRWDESIKISYEHSTFFIDLKRAGFKAAYSPLPIVEHKPPVKISKTDYDTYLLYRRRTNDKKAFYEKYKLDYTIDMSGRRDEYDSTKMAEVDFLITTFDRYPQLEKLLFSIREFYPMARIFIADQSKKFYASYYRALWKKLDFKNKPTAYNLPYDCGLSYARNFLLNKTSAPYILLLEDDFVFTDKTNINKMMTILEMNPTIGALGGEVLENGYPVRFCHYWKQEGDILYHVDDGDQWDYCDHIKYKKTGAVMNFTLFRRQLFNDVRWDEKIKIEGEHTDFYWRLSQTYWQVAFTPESAVDHNKIGNTADYKVLRKRNEFLKILLEKHYLTKIIYKNNYTIALEGGVVKKGKIYAN
ncbi:MAG: glycosyltransferase [Candidatus Komeilibacteria bacterium]|nr:glycosyltransferase [Candidatus Komeilibacteria bacterium]